MRRHGIRGSLAFSARYNELFPTEKLLSSQITPYATQLWMPERLWREVYSHLPQSEIAALCAELEEIDKQAYQQFIQK